MVGCNAEALEFAEEQELTLEMMGRVRRALRRIEDAGGAGVMEGALSTMTEEDIEKFRMERDERHAKAANPRYAHIWISHTNFYTKMKTSSGWVCFSGG